MTAATTPALKLADQLAGLAEHLRAHPHLPLVLAHGDASNFDYRDQPPALELQLSGFADPEGPEGVLLWAKTLSDVDIRLKPHGTKDPTATTITARGATVTGVHVHVWDVDVDGGDLYRWRGTEHLTSITLEQLAAYVAAGTVEHADEHTAGLAPELLTEAKYWADNPLPRDPGATS